MMVCVTLDIWSIDYRPGGWGRVRGDGVTVYLRLGSEGGARPRLHIDMATVSTDGPLTEAMWRSVPLAEVEMHLAVLSGVSAPDIDRAMAELAKPVEIHGYSPEALERYFAETAPLPIQGHIPGRTTVGGAPLGERIKLAKPASGRLTDEFLRDLAALYLTTVEAGKAPAPAIAGIANVPVRTVHRWVAEARRRGILPPAVKGKAG
jgi:hypothetical protein